MPLSASLKYDLNMSLLRNKSQEDLVKSIASLRADRNEPIVYRIGYSFATYIPALESAIIEAHTIVTEGKAKNKVVPYHIICS